MFNHPMGRQYAGVKRVSHGVWRDQQGEGVLG
jgi:hypothetical protein